MTLGRRLFYLARKKVPTPKQLREHFVAKFGVTTLPAPTGLLGQLMAQDLVHVTPNGVM